MGVLLGLASCRGGRDGALLGPGSPAASSDANLANLEVSQGGLDFSPDTTLYVVGPSLFDGFVSLTATTAHSSATMELRGGTFPNEQELLSGVPSRPIAFLQDGAFLEVVVTAEDGVTTKSYLVVVQRDTPSGLQTYTKASNTGTGDWFGNDVATSGDTVVVGAPFESSSATGVNGDPSNNAAPSSGAAYVFVYVGGAWTQQAYLKASNTGADDRFGSSVAISGDTIVVGAILEDSAAVGVGGDASSNGTLSSGAAYVFVRTGGVWTQQAYLKASNTGANDYFGASVSIDGDRIAVGAPGENSNAAGVDGNQGDSSAPGSGAVYLFARTALTWAQEAYVKAFNTETGDAFGTAVSLTDGRLAVGAPGEDSNAVGINGNEGNNSALDSGAAFLFVRDDLGWFEDAYLKGSDSAAGDDFGVSLSLSSVRLSEVGLDSIEVIVDLETLAVGAPGHAGRGAAYVFEAVGPLGIEVAWDERASLAASNAEAGDRFGTSVVAAWGVVVVGAPAEDSDAGGIDGDPTNNNALDSGAAYVFFENEVVTWGQHSYVKASNARAGDAFGQVLALFHGTLVVGARLEDSDATGLNGNQAGTGAVDSGAAYILR